MELLIKQLEELISPNEWCVTNLSNASALLMEVYADIGINLLMWTKILCRVNLDNPLIIRRFSLFSRHNNII